MVPGRSDGNEAMRRRCAVAPQTMFWILRSAPCAPDKCACMPCWSPPERGRATDASRWRGCSSSLVSRVSRPSACVPSISKKRPPVSCTPGYANAAPPLQKPTYESSLNARIFNTWQHPTASREPAGMLPRKPTVWRAATVSGRTAAVGGCGGGGTGGFQAVQLRGPRQGLAHDEALQGVAHGPQHPRHGGIREAGVLAQLQALQAPAGARAPRHHHSPARQQSKDPQQTLHIAAQITSRHSET